MNESIATIATLIGAWKDIEGPINPDFMLTVLKGKQTMKTIPATRTKPEEVISKKLPASYKSLNNLNPDQLIKVLNFWESLRPEQSDCLKEAREMMKTKQRSEDVTRSMQTTVHEFARVMELYNYPVAIPFIAKLRDSKSRQVLDANHLGSEEARNESNPYHHLLSIYLERHDTSEFNQQCVNPSVKYADNKIVMPVEINPQVNDEGYSYTNTPIDVQNIDPRRFIDNRTTDWLKNTMRKIEANLSDIVGKFYKSGLVDGGDLYTNNIN